MFSQSGNIDLSKIWSSAVIAYDMRMRKNRMLLLGRIDTRLAQFSDWINQYILPTRYKIISGNKVFIIGELEEILDGRDDYSKIIDIYENPISFMSFSYFDGHYGEPEENDRWIEHRLIISK